MAVVDNSLRWAFQRDPTTLGRIFLCLVTCLGRPSLSLNRTQHPFLLDYGRERGVPCSSLLDVETASTPRNPRHLQLDFRGHSFSFSCLSSNTRIISLSTSSKTCSRKPIFSTSGLPKPPNSAEVLILFIQNTTSPFVTLTSFVTQQGVKAYENGHRGGLALEDDTQLISLLSTAGSLHSMDPHRLVSACQFDYLSHISFWKLGISGSSLAIVGS